jgi:hypothetical protein
MCADVVLVKQHVIVFHFNFLLKERQECARASPIGTSTSSLDTELMTLQVRTPAVTAPTAFTLPCRV